MTATTSILILANDASQREAYKTHLEQQGYHCVAASYSEAAEVLPNLRSSHGVIVADIHPPRDMKADQERYANEKLTWLSYYRRQHPDEKIIATSFFPDIFDLAQEAGLDAGYYYQSRGTAAGLSDVVQSISAPLTKTTSAELQGNEHQTHTYSLASASQERR